MKRVVITGANGFVGAILSQRLSELQYDVVPVSRRAIEGGVQVQCYSETPSGDALIHLAEESHRGVANALGASYELSARNLVEQLSRQFSGKVIYASSAVIYGDQNHTANREQDRVVATDVYSRTKLENERTIIESGGTVVRLSNLFGVGMSSENVISDILKQLPEDGPVSLRDVSPIRDFLSVTDVVLALVKMFETCCSGIFNVGSGEKVSIGQLADMCLDIVGQPHRDVVSISANDKISINYLDVSKIKRELGWSPSSSLKSQLSNLIELRGYL